MPNARVTRNRLAFPIGPLAINEMLVTAEQRDQGKESAMQPVRTPINPGERVRSAVGLLCAGGSIGRGTLEVIATPGFVRPPVSPGSA